MTNPKISVIMPVLLSYRPGQTENPEKKFKRAIDSFCSQSYMNKELVIISDGCSVTNRIVSQNYSKFLGGMIKLYKLPPREDGSLFVGSTRQYGIDRATGDILTNLDADDYLMPNHLKNIAVSFDTSKDEWVYFNCVRKLDSLKDVEELVVVEPDLDRMFTTCLAWRKGLDVSWNNCDGRQDNKSFNKQLLEKYPRREKIYGCSYIIANAVISAVKV